jgi:5-deoxy-glucuronate isomerase
MMKLKGKEELDFGYNAFTEVDGKDNDIMMDFGILKLKSGMEFQDSSKKEKVFLLLYGKVTLEYDGKKVMIERGSFIDDDPITLDVPSDVAVKVIGLCNDSELAVMKTYNEKQFKPMLYEKCRREKRGEGQMNEAGTRIVKTVMDVSITTDSNFMLGEDVHYPGKWAGFPSHHHEQPEIYYYKFQPKQGFGLVKLGEEGVLVEQNDAIKVYPGVVHPQVAAPGYAMYFLWVIRHLDGNPYIKPTFVEKHLWVEAEDAVIWPEKG